MHSMYCPITTEYNISTTCLLLDSNEKPVLYTDSTHNSDHHHLTLKNDVFFIFSRSFLPQFLLIIPQLYLLPNFSVLQFHPSPIWPSHPIRVGAHNPFMGFMVSHGKPNSFFLSPDLPIWPPRVFPQVFLSSLGFPPSLHPPHHNLPFISPSPEF